MAAVSTSRLNHFPCHTISATTLSSTYAAANPCSIINFPAAKPSTSILLRNSRPHFLLGATGQADSSSTPYQGSTVAFSDEPSQEIQRLKKQLFDCFYGTDRGLRASSETRAEIGELITQLESKNPTPSPTDALPLLKGKWILSGTLLFLGYSLCCRVGLLLC
ncbi:Plastid lipid-associated protein 2, chloroplastic [Linum perenne]